MMDIYTNADYLDATGGTWHAEDSSWKAQKVLGLLADHNLFPARILEVGCGAGLVLDTLAADPRLSASMLSGFDVSPQAIELASSRPARPNLTFTCGDPFTAPQASDEPFDLLLALDVFEHVPDYLGFLRSCAQAADHKLYHVPLDLYALSVCRNAFLGNREAVGHLHYFTAESALATLRDTGHEIIGYRYTDSLLSLASGRRTWKRRLGNVPRRAFSRLDLPLTARVFGGWSLLVLTR